MSNYKVSLKQWVEGNSGAPGVPTPLLEIVVIVRERRFPVAIPDLAESDEAREARNKTKPRNRSD
jgi:hypothetical protein